MITPQGNVTTVAGSGNIHPSSNPFADGTGTVGTFNLPTGICVDQSSGLVVIVDFNNHRIRQLQNGIVSTVAGSGTAGWADGTSCD